MILLHYALLAGVMGAMFFALTRPKREPWYLGRRRLVKGRRRFLRT